MERLDVTQVIKKFQEIDKLKELLLDQNQKLLFQYIPKQETNMEQVYQKEKHIQELKAIQDQIIQEQKQDLSQSKDKVKQLEKNQETYALQVQEEINQIQVTYKAFVELIEKQNKSEKDKRVIMLMDDQIFSMFMKIYTDNNSQNINNLSQMIGQQANNQEEIIDQFQNNQRLNTNNNNNQTSNLNISKSLFNNNKQTTEKQIIQNNENQQILNENEEENREKNSINDIEKQNGDILNTEDCLYVDKKKDIIFSDREPTVEHDGIQQNLIQIKLKNSNNKNEIQDGI